MFFKSHAAHMLQQILSSKDGPPAEVIERVKLWRRRKLIRKWRVVRACPSLCECKHSTKFIALYYFFNHWLLVYSHELHAPYVELTCVSQGNRAIVSYTNETQSCLSNRRCFYVFVTLPSFPQLALYSSTHVVLCTQAYLSRYSFVRIVESVPMCTNL